METIDKKIGKRRSIWKKIIGIILLLITYVVGQVAVVSAAMVMQDMGIIRDIILVVLFVIPLVLMFFICGKTEIKLGEKTKFKWWYIVLVVACPVINVMKNPLLLMLFGGTGNTANGDALAQMSEMLPVIYTLGMSVVFSPIAEELLFRGIGIYTFFKKHLVLGLLISSIVFSLIHTPTDLFSFFNYFTMGIMFGGIFVVTKDLRVSIAAHILNNGFFMILVLLTQGIL